MAVEWPPDGRLQGPPPLRYMEQRESSYSRGERGEDVEGGPLWSPVRTHHISSAYLNGIEYKGSGTELIGTYLRAILWVICT